MKCSCGLDHDPYVTKCLPTCPCQGDITISFKGKPSRKLKERVYEYFRWIAKNVVHGGEE